MLLLSFSLKKTLSFSLKNPPVCMLTGGTIQRITLSHSWAGLRANY